MAWVKRWEVPSYSSPEKSYTVAQDDNGNFACSCPAWTRGRTTFRKECKHIRYVKSSGTEEHNGAIGEPHVRAESKKISDLLRVNPGEVSWYF